MPPVASDDLLNLQNRSQADPGPLPEDLITVNPENDLGGRSKKKGKSGKGKSKAAKAAAKPPPDDLYVSEPRSREVQMADRGPILIHRIAASPSLPEPSSCPEPPLQPPANTHHINHISSPVLDALESMGDTPDNDLTYRTDKWARAIPVGKSPPNDAVDGEMPSGSPLGFLSSADKAGFSNPSSASPPPRTRPLSYASGFSSNNDFSRQQSVDRPKSYYSMSNPVPTQMPPPPHLPQPHFYRAPEIDLPLFPGQGRSMSDSYSFCAFDTIPSPSAKPSRMGGNVLLVGSDGVLEVLAVEDRKSRGVGKLSGLNGRVVEAKVLPGGSSDDPSLPPRPHVAVITHGPSGPPDDESHTSSAASETHEIPAAGRQADHPRDEARFYQTRVEVYSLRTGDHVATLFTAKPTPCLDNLPGLPAFVPPPSGNLKLLAGESHVILASGVSGEVYVYAAHSYRCLGKTWTSIQPKEARRYSTSSSSTDPDGSRTDSPNGPASSDSAILALKGRWLSVVPPSASAYRSSIRGVVPPARLQGKAYGIETHSPPTKPTVNCDADVGDGESLFDKLARGVTQEFVRGARWVGDQSLQAWNNYWNKEQQAGPSGARRSPHVPDLPQPGYGLFPPTHAQETPAVAEPDLVSIVDLKRLEDAGDARNALLNPLATFPVPNGCSFLSFSPNGLMLLTASKKGDVQYVWDLLQAKICRAGAFLTDDPTPRGPNVRQIARYARLTTSQIVDVIWYPPSGERLAVITRKGTVHVFDLPRSAFQWPPFRRARPPPSKSPGPDPATDELADRAAGSNALSTAMKLVGGKAQPILAAVRGRTPSVGAALPAVGGFSSAAGVRGGKVVAAGLSKSMGAASGTVNTLRHVGENRLHLSGLSRDPAPGRVIWINHRGLPFLGLVDYGFFRLYRVRRSLSPQKNRHLQSVIGSKEIEYRLPPMLQSTCGPLSIRTFPPGPVVCAPLALPSANSRPAPAGKTKCQPLSQAEIETNAPYQPFHTDQRVSLYIYTETPETDEPLVPTGQWVFGGDMATSKLHVRPFSSGGDEETDDEGDVVHGQRPGLGGGMENHIRLGNSTGHGEEVVITTRRKKKRFPSTTSGADEGFFEDDCDVVDWPENRV